MINTLFTRLFNTVTLLSHSKLTFTFATVVVLFLPQKAVSQSILAQWPLSSNFTTVTFDANNLDNASYSKGSGINEWGIANYNLGGDWYDFTANGIIEEQDYIQFELSPKTGANAKNIYITSFELEMEQIPWFGSAGPRNYRIDYSKTADFSTFTTAAIGPVNTSFTVNDIQFASPLEVYSGETIYFRIYGYNSENEGDLIIKKNDFTVMGYVENLAPVNPVPVLDFEQDCANNGNLLFNLPAGFNPANETILIFAKAGSPINLGGSTALLSAYPTANNDLLVFNGSPYQHDANAKLVYKGTAAGPQPLINVTPGATYYFLAFNFLTPGGAGNISGGTFADGSVTGAIPDVENYSGIGTSTIVNLGFTAPNCVDAVMIVAKEGSINGTPSGNGSAYIPDPDFLGAGTPFDGGKVVYNSAHTSGSAGAVAVSGLTNQTTYHFKAWVRKGTAWSPGIELTAIPDISSIIITQVQSKGADFFEFMTLTRMDISNLNLTDQGVCESGAIFRNFSGEESEYENFFNASGNSDITTPLTDIPAGTYIRVYSGSETVDLDYSDGLMTLRNSGLNLDQNGDQALVYTGEIPIWFEDCGALPTPISAANDFASTTGWITSGTPDANTSYKPNTPAAFETLNSKGNSRFQLGNPIGDSTIIFSAIMNPSNWKHNNQNGDYWKLKKVLFQKSNKLNGVVAFSSISGSEFTIDASNLTFENTTISSRFIIVVYDGGVPDRPMNRYTCYQPNTDYSLAPDVVKSITQQFSQSEPCGVAQTIGDGKVVFLGNNLPATLTISGLRCDTEYNIKIVAINGNGSNMQRGTANKSTVTTTQDGGVQDTYYARIDGDFTDDIWSDTPTGSPQKIPPLSPCLKLVIQSPIAVTLDMDASFGELEIEPGGRIDLNTRTLSLQKNLTINGSIIPGTSKVVFNGNGGFQDISTLAETEFYDIEVDKNSTANSNTLFISGDIAVRNHVIVTAGDLEVKNGISLRLISDQPDQAAALIEVPSGSSVTGRFIVERYLPAISTQAPPGSGQGVGWRYLSAPIKAATFSTWNDDFTTTGLTGSDYPEYPYNINNSYHYFPSLQFYDETVAGMQEFGFDGDYMGAAPTIRVRRDITQPVQPGQGVFVYLGPVPLTFDAIGEPFTGELVYNLSFTNNGLTDEDGWNLVANPYPCAIDWDLVERSAEVKPFAYIYDATGSGNFVILEAGVSANHLIASGNAFWVKAANIATITFKESHKSNDVNVPFYKSVNPELNELMITLENTDYTSLSDFTKLRINENSTLVYDFYYDAYKRYSLNPYVPGLATQIDTISRDFAINAFNPTDSSITIQLKANIRVAGNYRFTFDFAGSQFESYCPVLFDKLTGSQVVISNGVEYEFDAQVNGVGDSARFSLIFTPTIRLETYDAVCNGDNNGEIVVNAFNVTPVTYGLFDANDSLYTSGTGQGEFSIDSLAWGFYRLVVSGLGGACPVIEREIFIGQPATLPDAGVTAYNALCKNSKDGEINISWEDSSYYQLSLFLDNELIGFVADASLDHSFMGLAPGDYQVQISNVCDTLQTAKSIFFTDSMHLDFVLPEDTIYLQDGGYVFYQNISENGYNFKWGFHPEQEAPIWSENGEFTYTEAGTYSILLGGTSAEGCYDHIIKQITVIDLVSSIAESINSSDRFAINYSDRQIDLIYELGNAKTLNLSVYDGLGKVYFKEALQARIQGNYTVPTTGLSAGIYFIRIDRNNEESLMLRFVVR